MKKQIYDCPKCKSLMNCSERPNGRIWKCHSCGYTTFEKKDEK